MAKRRITKEDKDLDVILAKIAKLKPTDRRTARAQTATTGGKRVRTYDMGTADKTPPPPPRDPYLNGITKRWSGEDSLKLANRIHKGIKERKRRNHDSVLANEVVRMAVQARESKPLPELPESMQPALPTRVAGDKPNIVALIYAFRSFQQYAAAHARRNLNGDEVYYQGLKARLKKDLEELGLADAFDWTDFGLARRRF